MFWFFKKKEKKEDIGDKILSDNVNYTLDEAENTMGIGEKTKALALLAEANRLQDSRGTIIDNTYFRLNGLIIAYIKKYGW